MKKRLPGWIAKGRGVPACAHGWRRWASKHIAALLGTSIVVVIVIVLTVVFWNWLRGSESPSATIRNVGLVIGGVIALGIAVWRSRVAQQQAETAQADLRNKRHQEGAAMLGSGVLAVRLAGIYAREQLAKEHPPESHIEVMKSLCAFVRNPTRDEDLRRVMEEGKMAVTRTGAEPEPEPREDVQAAIEAICARAEGQLFLETGAGFELDLSQADLRGVSLWEPNLAGAFLAGADFTGSTLVRPNFFGTWLGGRSQGAAHGLRGLDLSGSDLSGAALFEVDLTGTDLSGAKLTGAILTGANLSGTHFVGDLGEVVMGLTQQQLDSARADPGNDPYLEGVRDAVTGKQLVWRGKTLDLEPHPNPPEIPDD